MRWLVWTLVWRPERHRTFGSSQFCIPSEIRDRSQANQASTDEPNASGLEFPKTGPLQRDAVIDWIKRKKIIE